ncbi:hypothetical protein BDZ88DRAFT_26872 [Geranomyces variabilis]|nr:hypothetical protein BDZ88DRAFT_26872 [Geranomyces variabilis]
MGALPGACHCLPLEIVRSLLLRNHGFARSTVWNQRRRQNFRFLGAGLPHGAHPVQGQPHSLNARKRGTIFPNRDGHFVFSKGRQAGKGRAGCCRGSGIFDVAAMTHLVWRERFCLIASRALGGLLSPSQRPHRCRASNPQRGRARHPRQAGVFRRKRGSRVPSLPRASQAGSSAAIWACRCCREGKPRSLEEICLEESVVALTPRLPAAKAYAHELPELALASPCLGDRIWLYSRVLVTLRFRGMDTRLAHLY